MIACLDNNPLEKACKELKHDKEYVRNKQTERAELKPKYGQQIADKSQLTEHTIETGTKIQINQQKYIEFFQKNGRAKLVVKN